MRRTATLLSIAPLSAALLLAALILLPPLARSQAGAPIDPRPPAVARCTMTPAEPELNQSLEAARDNQAAIEEEMHLAETRLTAAQGQVEVKKKEIETIKARLDNARKLKQETEKATLEKSLKAEETQLDLLERVLDAEKAEAEWLEARQNVAEAEAELIKVQMDLAARRASQVGLDVTDTLKGEKDLRKLESRVFALMKARADKAGEAAGKEGDMVDRRVRVMEAWGSLNPL